MKIRSGLVALLLAGVLVIVAISGCATPQAPPPQTIQYDIAKEAKITQVSWYRTDGVLIIDIKVKNMSTAAKKFNVSVGVDDDVSFFAGVESGKELKPGEELVFKTQSSLATDPKTLKLTVAPQ